MDRDAIVGRVRAMYDAFGRGDAEAYREGFADDIVWHVPGDNPVSGAYAGRDEYFVTMPGRMGPIDSWRIAVADVLPNERANAALVRFHLTGERRGRRVDMDGYHMVRLDEDGRIVEGWGFTSAQDELDRFFQA